MSSLPAPRYSLWQAVSAALAAALRALDEVRVLARQPGPQGERGEKGDRGPDALGFDDMTVTYDGERTITIRFARGDQVKEFPFELPIVLDRGVWKEAQYKRGDGVTWGGSFFIAQRDTTAKPETPDSGWRLAIKRGRDGRDGKNGDKGDPGGRGDRGEQGPRGFAG